MTVSRYGHLQSAPVVVDVTYTHGVGTAYAPCSPVALHAPDMGASSMASCLSNVARTRLQGRCSAGHRDAFSVAASVKARSRSL